MAGAADFHFPFGDVLDHLADRIVRRAVILVQGGVDVLIRGHAQFDVGVDRPLQGVDHVQVGRIGQGDDDGVVVLGHGHGAVTFGHVPGHGGNNVVGQAQFGQVDEFVAEMGRLGLGDIDGLDDFFVEEKMDQSVSPGDPASSRTGATCSSLSCPMSINKSIK